MNAVWDKAFDSCQIRWEIGSPQRHAQRKPTGGVLKQIRKIHELGELGDYVGENHIGKAK